jgi:large repetitive protein
MRRRPLLLGGLLLVTLTLVDVPRPIGLVPALRVRKTVSVDGACPGADRVRVLAATSVTYCYTVTNTGDTLARDIVVTDGGGSVRVGALARGQSRTVTRTVVASRGAGAPAVTAGAEATTSEPAPDTAEVTGPDAVTPVLSTATLEAPSLGLLGSTPAAATTLQSP